MIWPWAVAATNKSMDDDGVNIKKTMIANWIVPNYDFFSYYSTKQQKQNHQIFLALGKMRRILWK